MIADVCAVPQVRYAQAYLPSALWLPSEERSEEHCLGSFSNRTTWQDTGTVNEWGSGEKEKAFIALGLEGLAL